MKKIFFYHKERTPILVFLILPLLGFWLTFNYFLGSKKIPSWSGESSVLSETTDNSPIYPAPKTKFKQLSWHGQGLVTIWFDDAWESQFTEAFPILEEKKFPAALSVTTKAIGQSGYMQWYQVKKLNYIGWEITSHSRSHNCNPQEMDDQMLLDEVAGSQGDLLKQGIETDHFVNPCGATTQELEEYIRNYYFSLRTAEGGLNKLPIENPYHIVAYGVSEKTTFDEIRNWINEASQQGYWLILMFHQIDNSHSDYSISPKAFREIINFIFDSKIEVVLPTEILTISKKD